MVFPTYLGFAAGFVAWGVSGALMSGTFEALVYDELAAQDSTACYARLMGWASSSAMTASLVATAVAAPLFAWGGYELVGWISVCVALGHTALAAGLPSAPAIERREAAASAGMAGRYLAMLKAGLAEVARGPRVRHLVLIASVMVALTAYDEFFPLMMRESGISTGTIPLVLAVIVMAQAVGTALDGRTEHMAARTMAWSLAVAVAAISAGGLAGGYAGFGAIALGYGLINNLVIVAEARLQHSIESGARATVTSVAGVTTEVVSITIFGAVALGSTWWSVSVVVAALGLPGLMMAILVARWSVDE
jgi:hypothetical protein